jgi:hypothetical protein|tara:strand:+ start:1219 stop:1446 length:228 start_codon:yes stop_codon:yes gene_type:complete
MFDGLEEYMVRGNLPEDIRVSLEALLKQARIMEEYDLDFIPGEYMANFMEALSKHPEFTYILNGMLETLIELDME